jgi:predicted TIM-barrel fold metal-dependent hydrolase
MNELWHKDSYFGLMMPVIAAFRQILAGDLPNRFPNLRFGFLEAGSAWVPAMVREVRRSKIHWAGQEFVEDAVARARCYIATRTDDDPAAVAAVAGFGQLVLGTDYGHTDVASEIEAHRTLVNDPTLDPSLARAIVADNAAALYGIDASALPGSPAPGA